ncbi:hypothetical protein D9757_003037 [Collybiopsis confluens]|uniref:AB hydrolase-1 domain-containing protein n=1 Tax=Collybiopsis confluens TaxID=2823264 RepID=A0A8H5HX82_9AGAR|nr:hypothetical protein D9757_003037 [Collybiopsis confluens]
MSSFMPSLSTVGSAAKGAFATAASLGTLGAGLLYYGQNYLIYPSSYFKVGDDDTGVPATPAEYGLHHEIVDLKTKDGQTLKCYLLPQKKELPKATKFGSFPTVPISAIEGATELGYTSMSDDELASHRPTVLMFHGNGGNAGHRQQVMRCNVLGVEYRGYGDSTGSPSESGFAIDAVTALEFVRGDRRFKNTPVILYGQSIGGAVAIDLASRFPGEIAGLILENTFLSLRLLIPHVMPLLGPFKWLCHQKWESAGKVIGAPNVLSQNRVEDRLAGLVSEQEASLEEMAAFKERLGSAYEVLDIAAKEVTEGGGSLERVGKGLGKEYKGIPRETSVLLLSGQSDELVPPAHMKFLRQVIEARPHSRSTLELPPLPKSAEARRGESVDEERSQFILFPGGNHNNTTAQHGYWNRVGDFVAEIGKEWLEQKRYSGGQPSQRLTLSLLATVASAAFSFAAPVTPSSNVLEARCLCQDIHSIITDVTTTLTPIVAELTYITHENCTVEVLTPIVGEIKQVLSTAITEVNALTGKTAVTLLTTVDGVLLTVTDVAALVVALLNLIFGALAVVLKVVTEVNVAAVIGLLCEVVEVVAELLQAILSVVGGLLVVLLTLLGDVVFSVIATLGLTSQFAFLHYTWSNVSSIIISSTISVSTSVASSVIATATA